MSLSRISRDDVFRFNRASDASVITEQGHVEIVPPDTIRHVLDPLTGEKRGILLEKGSVNYVVDSSNPKSQTITLPAGDFVVSNFGGKTTIDIPDAVPIEVPGIANIPLAAPTTIHIAPDSDVRDLQIEPGTVPTSYIRTSGGIGVREDENFDHLRTQGFAPSTGTFIGEFRCEDVEEGAVYFFVHDTNGDPLFSIVGNAVGSFDLFVGDEVADEFTEPPVDGFVQFAITYRRKDNAIRLFLNEEGTEVPYTVTGVVGGAKFAAGAPFIRPAKVIFRRYQYRPKALSIAEISGIFGFEFDFGYDYGGPPPVEVNNWADMIFAASTYWF